MSNLLRRFLACALLALIAGTAAGHDIPTDVRVQAFVKPQGQHLYLLIRVPLGAMNEVDLPLRGPGYLDLARADAALRVAAELWFADNLVLQEQGRPLAKPAIVATRVSLASDRSFSSWDSAMALLRSPPVPATTELYWKQQHFDLLLDYAIESERSLFAIAPRLARLGLKVTTSLVFLPPGGEARAFEFHGDPGLVALDPRWHEAARRFVVLGIEHILDGTDHLLFLAALVIPLRRLRPLLVVATAFTLAHSLTLAATAYGLAPDALWFPPLVETLIAASIVAMALENMLGTSARRRWLAAFAFGLVHGFGFAFALRETLQFAGSHGVTALFAFNLGVEIGQVAVLLVGVPLLATLLRVVPERAGVIVLSALVAHTGWHWMIERGSELAKFPWPTLDAATLAALLRWLMAALVIGLVAWALDRPVRRWMGVASEPPG